MKLTIGPDGQNYWDEQLVCDGCRVEQFPEVEIRKCHFGHRYYFESRLRCPTCTVVLNDWTEIPGRSGEEIL